MAESTLCEHKVINNGKSDNDNLAVTKKLKNNDDNEYCNILFLFFFRHLESCYPKFPSEKDFVNVIQGESGNYGEGSTDVGMLQRFVLEKERLQVSDILVIY